MTFPLDNAGVLIILLIRLSKHISKEAMFMKKMLFAAFCLTAAVFTGCTTVESTQVFNRMGLEGTTEDEMVGWHHQLDGHEFG